MIRKINPVYSSYLKSEDKSIQTMNELMRYGSTNQIAQLIGVVSYPVQDIDEATKAEILDSVNEQIKETKEELKDTLDVTTTTIINEVIPEEVEKEVTKQIGDLDKKIEELVDKVLEDIIPEGSITTPDFDTISSLDMDGNGHIVAKYREIAKVDEDDETLII